MLLTERYFHECCVFASEKCDGLVCPVLSQTLLNNVLYYSHAESHTQVNTFSVYVFHIEEVSVSSSRNCNLFPGDRFSSFNMTPAQLLCCIQLVMRYLFVFCRDKWTCHTRSIQDLHWVNMFLILKDIWQIFHLFGSRKAKWFIYFFLFFIFLVSSMHRPTVNFCIAKIFLNSFVLLLVQKCRESFEQSKVFKD